jgi:hypothetical protein
VSIAPPLLAGRGTDCPRRGVKNALARGIVTRRAEIVLPLLSSEARGEDGIGANSVEVVWGEVFVDPRALVGILGMSGVG